ncbi:MAG: hypothetical protein KME31_25640 [Tolypothrix carrinoi HA7290-LM1]|nr:hypothetical protein [Tolypothrix carrinoi HA7290-LM1]
MAVSAVGVDAVPHNGYNLKIERESSTKRQLQSVAIAHPKLKGNLGGYACFIAVCPPNWQYGVSVGEIPESPLQKADKALHADEQLGVRIRTQTHFPRKTTGYKHIFSVRIIQYCYNLFNNS